MENSWVCQLENGKVSLPQVLIDIVYGCNLRCTHCTHFSPYRSGYVSVKDFVLWCKTWREKLQVEEVRILGGEPFLHPELRSILLECRKIWDTSRIVVHSNGTLINQSSLELLEAIKEIGAHIIVSDHGVFTKCSDCNDMCRLLEQHKIDYVRNWADDYWWAQTQWDTGPLPFKSSPLEAWSNCWANKCVAIANNKLYKCGILAGVQSAIRCGGISDLHTGNQHYPIPRYYLQTIL